VQAYKKVLRNPLLRQARNVKGRYKKDHTTMDRDKETLDTWNNIASLYQEKFMELDLYNDTYDFICSSIAKPKAKLLEIGCGPGNITKHLLSKRPDFDIFGIDMAPNMVTLAQQNNPTAQFAVMDCREIHTLDIKYDGIIAGFCLPYLSQTESNELISNAYDLLNDDGLIYLSFVEGEPDRSDFKVGSGGRVYFYYHKLDDIISQLNNLKFGEIKTVQVKYTISETDFDLHTILTAKKKNAM
jgi:2-polyprenyl-3-methyl-5-hydroxy-6-metoxy-1,4-benzoquinol methylase